MLVPNWSEVGTREELEANIGDKFTFAVGWIETSTDTAYVEEVNCYGAEPRYLVRIWNATGIRAALATMLGQPVYRS
jgi:hypothetical protein